MNKFHLLVLVFPLLFAVACPPPADGTTDEGNSPTDVPQDGAFITWNLNGARFDDYANKIEPDLDGNGNGIPDDLETATPGEKMNLSSLSLGLWFVKPDGGRLWKLTGIEVKTNSDAPVTVREESLSWSDTSGEHEYTVNVTDLSFTVPDEPFTVSLIWEEAVNETYKLLITQSSADSLTLLDTGEYSLGHGNFRILNADGEQQDFITYCAEIRYIGFTEPLPAGEYTLQFLLGGEVGDEATFTVSAGNGS